jgi:hypothetical protein
MHPEDDEGDEDRTEDADEKEIALALCSMTLEPKGMRPPAIGSSCFIGHL